MRYEMRAEIWLENVSEGRSRGRPRHRWDGSMKLDIYLWLGRINFPKIWKSP
jgi:hypothetical protein